MRLRSKADEEETKNRKWKGGVQREKQICYFAAASYSLLGAGNWSFIKDMHTIGGKKGVSFVFLSFHSSSVKT